MVLPCFAFSCLALLASGVRPNEAARLDSVADEAVNSTSGDESCSLTYPLMDKDGASQQCRICVAKKPKSAKGCKWCALKQFCALSPGESCSDGTDEAESNKIKTSKGCAKAPPWEQLMEEAYGSGWSSNRAKHLDAIRCVQWSLGWPLEDVGHQAQIDTSKGTGFVGISVSSYSEAGQSWLKVDSLNPQDLAAQAGLKEGQVITSFNRAQVRDPNEFIAEVERLTQSKSAFTLEYGDIEQMQSAGRWGCVSAMLRDGMLAMMEKKVLPLLEDSKKSKMSMLPFSNLEVSQQASEAAAGLQGDYTTSNATLRFTKDAWSPKLCNLLRPFLHKLQESSRCFITSWQTKDFAKLRSIWSSLDGQLFESVKSGPIVPLRPGAGKSGSGFGSLGDGAFKVKMGLKQGSKLGEVNEPYNLMQMMSSTSSQANLLDHFAQHPDSLINRVFGMLQIGLGDMTSWVAILEDGFYEMDAAAMSSNIEFTRYDLKGASRNEEEKAGDGWCLVNGDFKEREQNTLHLKEKQCLRLREAVKADATFLQASGMIDYSLLLLSAKKEDSRNKFSCKLSKRDTEPFCAECGKNLYTFSIIDYLNDMNWAKSVESTVKGGKFSKYDKKISFFIQKICRTPAEEVLRQRVLSMGESLGGLWKVFKKIDTGNDGSINSHELEEFLLSMQFSPSQVHDMVDSMEFDVGPSDAPDRVSFKGFKWLFA